MSKGVYSCIDVGFRIYGNYILIVFIFLVYRKLIY